FSDPLYSPGSDLISLHNTMIVDAITAADDEGLIKRCHRSETLLQALYAGYVPSYAESYDALGDAEAFAMKYSWELAVYFGFYVFPFINDLFTDERFVVIFLRRFAQLGAVNGGLHRLLSQYFQWKKATNRLGGPVADFELSHFAPLARAEKTFYRVGVSADEARRELDLQLASLDELARFIAARITSVFLGRPAAKDDAGFVAALDPATCTLDADSLSRLWEETHNGEPQVWTFDSGLLDCFDRTPQTAAVPANR
ncbi:MAG: hypothetical protein K8J08_10015, partial [Thermoanaerobaculia bacterium]|nr:hypothetical protein [Thermoanaerobaculia bacterium]